MSITSYFLLFLLCLSMHACGASRLGAVDNKNKIEKKITLHFSFKNNKNNNNNTGSKKNLVVVHAKSTSLKEMKIQSLKQEIFETSQADRHDTQKLKDAQQVNSKSKNPGAVQANKSVGSVSWRVPHRKRGEKNPGFNLDYSPPKTHPPSHN